MAKIFKLKINKFSIMIYGSSCDIDDVEYKSILTQILVYLGGPLTVFILQFFLWNFKELSLISSYYYNLYTNMNISLCVFNLLPIYPLDGGRILDVILKYFIPVKKVFKFRLFYMIVTISLLTGLLIYLKQYILMVMFILCLISEVISYYNNYDDYLKKRFYKRIEFEEDISNFPDLYHFKNNIYFIDGEYKEEIQIIPELLLENDHHYVKNTLI